MSQHYSRHDGGIRNLWNRNLVQTIQKDFLSVGRNFYIAQIFLSWLRNWSLGLSLSVSCGCGDWAEFQVSVYLSSVGAVARPTANISYYNQAGKLINRPGKLSNVQHISTKFYREFQHLFPRSAVGPHFPAGGLPRNIVNCGLKLRVRGLCGVPFRLLIKEILRNLD